MCGEISICVVKFKMIFAVFIGIFNISMSVKKKKHACTAH